MNAVVSGRAGVALVWDGPQFFSLHVEALDEPIPRREAEIPYLLGEAKDLLEFRSANQAYIAKVLGREARCFDALHLTLCLLDRDLTDKTREEVAKELEGIFGENPRHLEFAENVLFSNPLPPGGDLPGALRAARGTVQTQRLLSDFERLQSRIAEVWIAWLAIPDRLFIRPENRQKALNAAVRSGGFRRFVRLAAENENDGAYRFLQESLANPEVQEFRAIWAEWVKPLREESRYPLPQFDALEVAEPPAPGFDVEA